MCVCVSVLRRRELAKENSAEEEESVEAKVSIPPLVFLSFLVLRSLL